MVYIMLPDLQVVLFFVCPIIKSFKNVFMRCLVISYVIIYRTTIIPNIQDKVANYIESKVVEGWLT